MIEQELIAAVLRSPSALLDCDCLPEHFESEVHQTIWQTIIDLQSRGEPFDAVTLMEVLPSEAGNRVVAYVNESVGITANAAGYSRKIVEGWRERQALDVYAKAAGGEVTRDEVIQSLMALDNQSDRFEASGQQALKWALADMEEAAENEGRLRGITTGLADLDACLGGFHDGDLTVEGARPAMGKTALLIHHAMHCGVPYGFVSAEQPAHQIAQRMVAARGGVSLSDLRHGRIGGKEMEAVKAAQGVIKQASLYDRSSPSILEVERVARRWRHRQGIKILFVDYIQRIRGAGERRHEQVGDVVRRLKTLARDLGIPVVALSQVGRQVEGRENKRPSMGDLSDSSEIEKEADQILTLYRDEVYDRNSDDKGLAEINIAKNRHGYCGAVKVAWMGEHVRFGNLMRAVA